MKKTKQPSPLSLEDINKKYGLTLSANDVPVLFKYSEQILNDLFMGDGTSSVKLKTGTGRGFPAGRIVEIIGPESSGKTTFCLETIKQYQRCNPNGVAAFIDFEHALDKKYAANIGVVWSEGKKDKKVVRCLYASPTTAEEGSDLIVDLVRSKQVGLIVVDSVAAMVMATELANDMGAGGLGRHAAHMSSLMRKITPLLSDNACSVLFINQIRMKIGVMFGNPETTPGGNALKFFASVRLDIRKGKPIKQGKKTIGGMAQLRAFKNKVGVPNQMCFLKHINGKGIVGVTTKDPNKQLD